MVVGPRAGALDPRPSTRLPRRELVAGCRDGPGHRVPRRRPRRLGLDRGPARLGAGPHGPLRRSRSCFPATAGVGRHRLGLPRGLRAHLPAGLGRHDRPEPRLAVQPAHHRVLLPAQRRPGRRPDEPRRASRRSAFRWLRAAFVVVGVLPLLVYLAGLGLADRSRRRSPRCSPTSSWSSRSGRPGTRPEETPRRGRAASESVGRRPQTAGGAEPQQPTPRGAGAAAARSATRASTPRPSSGGSAKAGRVTPAGPVSADVRPWSLSATHLGDVTLSGPSRRRRRSVADGRALAALLVQPLAATPSYAGHLRHPVPRARRRLHRSGDHDHRAPRPSTTRARRSRATRRRLHLRGAGRAGDVDVRVHASSGPSQAPRLGRLHRRRPAPRPTTSTGSQSYSDLALGHYTFSVRATDTPAAAALPNTETTPATFGWTSSSRRPPHTRRRPETVDHHGARPLAPVLLPRHHLPPDEDGGPLPVHPQRRGAAAAATTRPTSSG